MGELIDLHGRRILYLRVSITSNCNLRCAYCTSDIPSHRRGERKGQLSVDELIRVVECAQKLGVKGVRITGGEPLMREEIVDLVSGLAAIDGIGDISMTTNGMLLSRYAYALREAGLKRINISFDSLKRDKLRVLSGADPLTILDGIDAALSCGFECVKLNCVVMREFNLDEITELASLSIDRPLHVRFIELQPVGCRRQFFVRQFVSAFEMQERLKRAFELEPVERGNEPVGFGPAKYWRIKGAFGTIGFIAPVSEPFCSSCNRLRLTSNGILRPCLAHNIGIDIKQALKDGDEAIEAALQSAVMLKPLKHNYACTATDADKCRSVDVPMREIGG